MFVHLHSTATLITNSKKLPRGEHDLQIIEATIINLDNQKIHLSITTWLPKNTDNTTHIDTVTKNDVIDLDGAITEIKNNKLAINAYRLQINSYDPLNLPTNKSYILAAGFVETKAKQQEDQMTFRMNASQHKGDKTAANPFNEYSIFCSHDIFQTHLSARTSRLQPRSKLWISGDFGVDDNDLYVQLNSIEYMYSQPTKQTKPPSTPSIEKSDKLKFLVSLSESSQSKTSSDPTHPTTTTATTRKRKTTSSSTITDTEQIVETDEGKPSNKNKKINKKSDLASNQLDLPDFQL
jgi:hypothetical protein